MGLHEKAYPYALFPLAAADRELGHFPLTAGPRAMSEQNSRPLAASCRFACQEETDLRMKQGLLVATSRGTSRTEPGQQQALRSRRHQRSEQES